jgi:hypothetical protein
MKSNHRTAGWVLAVWLVFSAAVGLASACSSSSSPNFVPPDSTKRDTTTKTGFVTPPAFQAGIRV